MRRAIFDGEVDTVVVWMLDRISRRQHEGIGLLADWCERGISVVVVTQQIDLSGAVGRMVASVLFGLAEIELGYCPDCCKNILRSCRAPGWWMPEICRKLWEPLG